jgi:hypothetical protein
MVFQVSLLSQTDSNFLGIESRRKDFERLTFEGPGSDSIFENRVPFSGNRLNIFPLKQLIKQNIFPGNYICKTWVEDKNKNKSGYQSFSFNLLNPDFPALGIDSPVNSFFAVPEIKGDSFLLQIRGFGSRIQEMSYQWYDSIPAQSLGERQIQNVPSEPNEYTFKSYLYFPNARNRNLKLRLGIKNKSDRAAYYWLDVKRIL